MRTSMRTDLTAALKTRDRVAVTALRSALAAIENAEAVPGEQPLNTTTENEYFGGASVGLGAAEAQRRQLTDADLRSILEKEIHERAVSAAEYDALGQTDAAGRLRAEAEVLGRYLPG